MAKDQKQTIPPAIPQSLAPVVQAFFEESEEIAQTLIEQAAEIIYAEYEAHPYDIFAPLQRKGQVSKKEIANVYAMMKSIQPKDILEAISAAQIVATHMLGMKKMAQPHTSDQLVGMKMLSFSSDAIERLVKRRSGGMQTINVNYINQGPSMQSLTTNAGI